LSRPEEDSLPETPGEVEAKPEAGSGILDDKITRRQAISRMGGVAAVVVVAAVAGAGGYYYLSTQGAAQTTTQLAKSLNYLGNDIALGQQAIAEFNKETGGTAISSTSVDFFTLAQRLASSGGQGWDVGFTGRIKNIIPSGSIAPIPVANLPRWVSGTLETLIVSPETFLSPNYVKRFNALLWKDLGKELWAVPNIWNYDSVGYLPEFVQQQENGGAQITLDYHTLYDPQWKGKTALQDEGFTCFSETANYLNANNQLNVSDTVTNLTQQELTSVQSYLNPILSSGQVKAFWSDFGKIVTLMSTREIYAASCWQPVVYFTRAAGTPAYYSRLKDGPFFWWNGDLLSSKIAPSSLSAAYAFFNFQMAPWWAANTAHNGYGVADSLASDIKPFMGDEFWNWFFNGTATYEPISQITTETWKDHPEFQSLSPRIQQALFRPDLYFPTGGTPRTGSPDPKGNVRDLGSTADKNKITRYFLSPDFPDTPTAYQTAFSALKANIPA